VTVWSGIGPILQFSWLVLCRRVKEHTWNVQPDFSLPWNRLSGEVAQEERKRDRIKPWITSPDGSNRFPFTTDQGEVQWSLESTAQ